MHKKLIFAGVLVGIMAWLMLLSPQMSRGPDTAQADPFPGNIQGFNVDSIQCFGGTEPNPEVAPPWPMMSCSGENLAKSAVQGYTLAISLESGNRRGLPYEYVGPGWTQAADAAITDGSKVGDVSSTIDLLCDGTIDRLADSSGASTPEPFYERTTTWTNNSGIGGKSEMYLDAALPPPAVMSRVIRYRADIDTVYIGGTIRYPLSAPSALNSVMMHPVWSPAGATVTTIMLGGDIAAPGQQIICQDMPQSSKSRILAQTPGGQQIQANPSADGLYARWVTEVSEADAVSGQVSFSYATYCKQVGAGAADADNDCLSNAAETTAGTNPAVADTDGDGLLDGMEVAWGSNPLVANTDGPGDGCSDLEEMIGPTQFLSNPTNADTDGDGVPDGCLKANMTTAVFESDGPGRVRFTVQMNNGASNRFQAGGDNCPSIANAGQLNTDAAFLNGDFYGDACDTDIDNDGVVNEAETGFVYDKQYNVCRSDGEDGVPDGMFRSIPVTPLVVTNPDTDGDGISDGRECELGSDPTNASSVVTRYPTVGDGTDNDGLNVGFETGWRTQHFNQVPPTAAVMNVDGDAFLTGDTDLDSDNDGLNDACELLTLNSVPTNPDQNRNGTLDGAEFNCNGKVTDLSGGAILPAVSDIDSDGVPNATDNCVNVGNGPQTNTPLGSIDNGPGVPIGDSTCATNDASVPMQDKLGDACDDDTDNDLLPDVGLVSEASLGTDSGSPTLDTSYDDGCNGIMLDATDDGPSWDSDGDTVLDGVEVNLGTNPMVKASKPPAFGSPTGDNDNDKLVDGVEVLGWGTDPASTDSDGDGKSDCKEIGDNDGNGSVSTSDLLNEARAALVASPATKSGDMDIDKNGAVTTSDVIAEARIALVAGWCP